MNNFVFLLISAMAHAGIFTKDEAEALCKEMQYSTLPDSFEAAYIHVEKIFQKADVGKKVNTNLESQVAELRTELGKVNKWEQLIQKNAEIAQDFELKVLREVNDLRTEINSIKTPQMIAHIKANATADEKED